MCISVKLYPQFPPVFQSDFPDQPAFVSQQHCIVRQPSVDG